MSKGENPLGDGPRETLAILAAGMRISRDCTTLLGLGKPNPQADKVSHALSTMACELLVPAVRPARTAAEPPGEAEADPVAHDRGLHRIPQLLGIAEHAAGHKVHVDSGKHVGHADAARNPMLARNGHQPLRETNRTQSPGSMTPPRFGPGFGSSGFCAQALPARSL